MKIAIKKEIGQDRPREKQQIPQELKDNLQEELADILDQAIVGFLQ